MNLSEAYVISLWNKTSHQCICSYSIPLDVKMTHIMTVLLVPAMDPMTNMDAAHHKLAELMVAPCAQFTF